MAQSGGEDLLWSGSQYHSPASRPLNPWHPHNSEPTLVFLGIEGTFWIFAIGK